MTLRDAAENMDPEELQALLRKHVVELLQPHRSLLDRFVSSTVVVLANTAMRGQSRMIHRTFRLRP